MVAEVKVMEINKVQQKVAAEKTFSKIRVRDFIEDLKAEIYRITWTTREELIVYTKIVVASTFVFGLGIYCTDLIIQGLMNGLSLFFQLIGG